MKQVVVYPSGFVGYDVGWPVIRTEQNFNAQQALIRFNDSSLKQKLSISNTTIEALYTQYKVRARNMRDASFISDVTAAFANAFGTTSFYEWCHMQLSNPYFTADHRQYLNETLLFINGKPRTYSFTSWAFTLNTRVATVADKTEPYEYQEIMLGWGMSNTSVLQVMDRWIRQPGGIDDMLIFAHLVFGDNFEK